MCVVCTASLFVYRGGMQVLEERADAELTFQVYACRASVRDRLEQITGVLELLSGQEMNRSILAKDPDDEIGKALRTTIEQWDCFTELSCLDHAGEVVASTRYPDIGTKLDVPAGARRAFTEGGRAHAEREGQLFTLTVPVHYQFDELECIGFFRAKCDLSTLLVDERGSLSRITTAEGEVLAERGDALPRADGGKIHADHVHAWGNPDLATKTVSLETPRGLNDLQWSVAVAQCNSDLLVEATVLRQMVVLLTSVTAGLVLALVLLFSRFEGRLIGRLVDRARELGLLNQKLDRSRSDLVKAARIAGMSEVATGILHSVGNTLNSLTTATHKVDEALLDAGLANLRHLVGHLEREDDEFAQVIRGHSKGPAFLAYLSELTRRMESDRARARDEIGCVRTNVDLIATLVSSQQKLVTRSSVRENTAPCDLMEGALVISGQVLGAPEGIRIERDFAVMPDVLIEKHRVMEILVNLINNARHSLEEARRSEPVLTLRITASDGGTIRLQVADNGVGIPAQNMVKIFHHGFSTRPGGHGFGLHASINSARELGGALAAESPGPGRGATFTLELPLELAPAA